MATKDNVRRSRTIYDNDLKNSQNMELYKFSIIDDFKCLVDGTIKFINTQQTIFGIKIWKNVKDCEINKIFFANIKEKYQLEDYEGKIITILTDNERDFEKDCIVVYDQVKDKVLNNESINKIMDTIENPKKITLIKPLTSSRNDLKRMIEESEGISNSTEDEIEDLKKDLESLKAKFTAKERSEMLLKEEVDKQKAMIIGYRDSNKSNIDSVLIRANSMNNLNTKISKKSFSSPTTPTIPPLISNNLNTDLQTSNANTSKETSLNMEKNQTDKLEMDQIAEEKNNSIDLSVSDQYIENNYKEIPEIKQLGVALENFSREKKKLFEETEKNNENAIIDLSQELFTKEQLIHKNECLENSINLYQSKEINTTAEIEALKQTLDEKENIMQTYLKDVLDKFFKNLLVSNMSENNRTQFKIYLDLLASFLGMNEQEKTDFGTMLKKGQWKKNLRNSIIF